MNSAPAMDACAQVLPAGCVLDERFVVRETIATGGMGCVYLAYSLALDRPVAVKVLRAELVTRPEAVECFRREALLASAVRHPNIAQIIDYGDFSAGLPYMVMEYVAGPSLAELLRREGPQSIERAVSFMEQLLAALEELHARGIAHGDITSANLLLQPTSDGCSRLKLVDFGLARRLLPFDDHGFPDGFPLASQVSGTPGYMAPEVIRGEPLSRASDMYSAGVLLHELVTGELPFTAATSPQLMMSQLASAPMPPSVRFPTLGIPPGFDTLVGRALSMHEHERLGPAALGAALAALTLGCASTSGDLWRAAAREHLVTATYAPSVGASTVAPRSRPEKLRDYIGHEMRRGDVDQVADLYLGLAVLLRETGNAAAAIAELGEAVDVLTRGGGAELSGGPAGMWRLLLLLAEMQLMKRDVAAARASAALAYRHADRAGSGHGRSRVLHFVRCLPRE